MDWSHKLMFVIVLIGFEGIYKAHGDAMVTGSVFCDQCKDGQLSLFDYPLNGIQVYMACPGSDGQLKVSAEEKTDWLGHFTMRFDGLPDLRSCYVSVFGQGSSGCSSVAGPAKAVSLMFRIFDTALYIVDTLVSQPAEPVSYCPRSTTPQPRPGVPVSPSPPPPVTSLPPPTPSYPPPVTSRPPPMPAYSPPVTTLPLGVPVLPSPPPPVTSLPPPTPSYPPPVTSRPPPMPAYPPPVTTLPPPMPAYPSPVTTLPPATLLPPLPPAPLLDASACTYQTWTRPEYRCHWKVLSPDSKVAVVFGLIAATRYGTDMTLFEAMQGRGDPYRTLLREAITALLNSYNSQQFPYHPLTILAYMNYALMADPRRVLHIGLGFLRANSGYGQVQCKLTACN